MSGSFKDRYLIARYPSGGVVVDLESGNYFRVDSTAAEICDALRSSEATGALDDVTRRLRLPRAHAARAIEETVSALSAAAVRGIPSGPYHFHPEDGGYGLWHDGKRVLAVARDDLSIYIPVGTDAGNSPILEFYVRALAPKIMFIRGVTVLHAAACKVGEALIAFAGPSGAGKTTTAQAFVGAGVRPLVEDLLVISPDAAAPAAVVSGERRVHLWAKQKAAALAAGVARVSSEELALMAEGPQTTLTAIRFLDVSRRAGSDFEVRPLNGPDAIIALMANDFLGAASTQEWRRYFETAVSIAERTDLAEVTAPLGLPNLQAAAARYRSNWTS